MVKVTNAYGDFKTGKQGTAVYQGHYGNQVRHKWDGKKKNDKPKQIAVQEKFKAGLEFANTLTSSEKQALEYFIDSKKLRMTWHNYACAIAMTPPKVKYSASRFPGTFPFVFSQSLSIEQPAIKKIDLVGKSNEVFYSVQLTNIESGNLVDKYSLIPEGTVTAVDVTTADDRIWHMTT